jgi:hypothetical protein
MAVLQFRLHLLEDSHPILQILNVNSGKQLAQVLPVNAIPLHTEDSRWYLEDYAVENPFECDRASAVYDSLAASGSALIAAIDWRSVLSKAELLEPLVIEVEDLSSGSGDDQFFWEILEQRMLWPKQQPPAISVVRTIQLASPAENLQDQASKASGTGVFNILVVTARPHADKDVPHRLVSRGILDVMQSADGKGMRSATMEIVRPGTFAAFRDHLNSREPGYFDIVHFDLHGIADSSGRYECNLNLS